MADRDLHELLEGASSSGALLDPDTGRISPSPGMRWQPRPDPMPSRAVRLEPECGDVYLSPEAYHRAWARYRATRPPGLFESLWNLIRPWRKP